MFEISPIEFILFFCYPLLIISISVYLSITKEMNSEIYFFGDKNIHCFIIGISFTTSAFFSPYLLSLISPDINGAIPLTYGIITSILFFVFGWKVFPLYSKIKIKTIPEYFEIRYNKVFRFLISGTYIFMNIGIRLFLILSAGNVLINTFTELDSYFSILFFLVLCSISLIISGLKAELYINAINTVFISLFTTGFTYWFIHQYSTEKFGLREFSYLPIFISNLDLSIVKSIIGLPILGFWFLCADQIMLQKSRSINNVRKIKKSSITSMLFQLVPILIFTLSAFVVLNLVNEKSLHEIKNLFFREGFLPVILQYGFIISFIFLITTLLFSSFNSTVSLIAYDFYSKLKSNVSDRELVLVGRITIIILLFISIILLTIACYGNFTFYINLFYSFFYLASLITALQLCGLLFNFIRSEVAIFTFLIGLILIIFKTIHEILFSNRKIGFLLLDYLINANSLEYTIFIFLLSVTLLFIGSKIHTLLLTESNFTKSPEKKIFLAFPIYVLIIGLTNMINI